MIPSRILFTLGFIIIGYAISSRNSESLFIDPT